MILAGEDEVSARKRLNPPIAYVTESVARFSFGKKMIRRGWVPVLRGEVGREKAGDGGEERGKDRRRRGKVDRQRRRGSVVPTFFQTGSSWLGRRHVDEALVKGSRQAGNMAT